MSTISVPITKDYYYDQVMQAQEEMRAGKIIRGDLKTLLSL